MLLNINIKNLNINIILHKIIMIYLDFTTLFQGEYIRYNIINSIFQNTISMNTIPAIIDSKNAMIYLSNSTFRDLRFFFF